MIQDKINAIEGQPQTSDGSDVRGNETAAQLEKKKNDEADAMQAKLTKIYKNGDIDNKQKIAEMVDLFNEEVIEFYKNSFMDIV